MAIQDDIMAMLSQVSDGGNRATAAGKEGVNMYGRMSELITDEDKMYKARRELGSLYDPIQFGSLDEQMRQDPLTGGGVADIIRKYMDDAGDGVPADAGLLVGESPPAEIDPMMELVAGMGTPAPRTPVGIEKLPSAAPRIRVNAEQLAPPSPRPDFDPETAESLILERDEGLSGLMAGQMAPLRASDIEPMAEYRPGQAKLMGAMRDMSQSPSARRPEGMPEAQNQAFTRMMKSQISNELFPRTGMSPEDAYDLFMSGDGEAEGKMMDRMGGPSGREYIENRGRMTEGDREYQALAIGSTFIPFAAIPKLAAQVGISAGVVNKFLSAGPAGVKRLEAMIRSKLTPIPNKTPGARMRQRVDVSRQPNPNNGFNDAMNETTRRFTATGGAASGGQVNNIRDKIMNTYGRM